MPPNVDEIIKGLKSRWNLVAQSATWLGSVVGKFFRPPPPSTPLSAGEATLTQFGEFFLTLAVGLLLIPVWKWQRREHAVGWVIAAAVLVILTPIVYFSYDMWTAAWTCRYGGGLVVIGSELTPQGQAYKAENPDFTDEELVFESAGRVDEVWTKGSIDARRRTLAVMYVLSLPLFASGVICVLQAIYCATRSKSARGGH